MKKQAETIALLLEKSPISAWMVDADQKIVYMNANMQDLFGDLTGQSTSIIYESGSCEVVEQPGGENTGSSEVIVSDVPFRRLSSTVDLGEEGLFLVEYFEDISEQKLIGRNMKQTLAKINAETKIAKTIQSSILPINDKYWNTIAFNSLYTPADDLGGDFYDLIRLSEDEYLIYIADVAGHGIQASLLTIFMRERVRANAEEALAGTGKLLSKLIKDYCALELDYSMYITMVLCKYTRSKRELTIANAGHNCFPLIVRDNGRLETIPTRGMPVSIIADGVEYEEEIVVMRPGDRLILFTDGIIEEVDSTTGKPLGIEGLRELAAKYHDYDGSYMARKVMDVSNRYALISARDDRSIVVVDILS